MFSRRLHWDLTPNLLSKIVTEMKAAGATFLDLTVSNPTRSGFAYPAQWAKALTRPEAFAYEPAAQGLWAAREAVARYYLDHGVSVHPEDVFLTASTSEAYAYLFKLLTDPGDEVLVPRPSYPLFDFLANLEYARTHPYPAEIEDVTPWRAERTRALVAVHPNNPAGECVAPRLIESCAAQSLPCIVDEVFLDYGWTTRLASFAGVESTAFVLSGLSKVCGLPQMKLGWILLRGAERAAVRARLELIADTYLSASTPVQWAAVDWLDQRELVQEQIRARIGRNLALVDAAGLARRPGQGGWSAVLELREDRDEERFVVDLLEQDGVLVQPGYFYDFAGAPVVVVSLLADPAVLEPGLDRIRSRNA